MDFVATVYTAQAHGPDNTKYSERHSRLNRKSEQKLLTPQIQRYLEIEPASRDLFPPCFGKVET